MGLKNELKRDMRNFMADIDKEISKTWKLKFEGHSIEIVIKLNTVQLIIDGQVVDQNVRKKMIFHIKPYYKLSGKLDNSDGKTQIITVKIGGFTELYCIVKVGNKTVFEEFQKMELLPWKHKEKIVPYILEQVKTHNKIVDESLPDDRYFYNESESPQPPGFTDYFINEDLSLFFTKKLIKLFEKQINEPNEKTRRATYEHIIFGDFTRHHNEFIGFFKDAQLDKTSMQQEAIWLLENACHRDVVKFAITVLSFSDCNHYKNQLLKIGMHEEFTYYVILALKNGTVNANESLWELAKSTQGWGKIMLLQQLEATTSEIEHWFIIEGYKNKIHHSYSAYICAIKGKLDLLLYENSITREVYESARNIIEGLFDKKGSLSIEDYPYTGQVLSRFVYHSQAHCSDIEDVYLLLKIKNYLKVDEDSWEKRFNNNWNELERNSIKEMLELLLNNLQWATIAHEVLKQNQYFNWKAFIITQHYKLDVTGELFKFLEREPINNKIYIAIMNTTNRKYVEKLCNYVESNLPTLLNSYSGKVCLQIILKYLIKFEGLGLPIVKAVLNRNGDQQYFALNVLKEWSKSIWYQQDIVESLKIIAKFSEDEINRKLAKQLLVRKF